MTPLPTQARSRAPMVARGACKSEVLEIARHQVGDVRPVTRLYRPIGCLGEIPIVELWRVVSMVPRQDDVRLADCRLELVGLNPVIPSHN